MTDCYIFDLGRVLFDYNESYITGRYVKDPADADTVCKILFDRLYWDRLDSGTITDEEVKQAACERLPVRLHALACAAYDNWFHCLPPIAGMKDVLLDLKSAGKRLYLLSNISIGFSEHYRENPELAETLSLFDGLVFSGPLHITKPHPEIFRHLLNEYGLSAQNCTFIDDSARNIQGAEAVGLHTILFEGDAEKLRTQIFG